MTSSLKLYLLGAALVAVASTSTAAELRLSEAEMDRVAAGNAFPAFPGEFGVPVLSTGNNPNVEPFPQTTFGDFELFDGPLSPPPPVVTPPVGGGGGGGGGSPIQNLLALLLGLSSFPR